MWSQVIYICGLMALSLAEMTAPGIHREIGDEVKSMGYRMVYGDEDMTVINEVVSDMEKSQALKSSINLNQALPPLPAQDVKCLMSVDKYCSKKMGEMKNILVKALKDDCKECTEDQKEEAGKVAASMMAHDPMAWKTFLTRYDGQQRVQRILGCALQNLSPKSPPKKKPLSLIPVGDPEEILNSKFRHTKPGFKVRVKRYVAVEPGSSLTPIELFEKHAEVPLTKSGEEVE